MSASETASIFPNYFSQKFFYKIKNELQGALHIRLILGAPLLAFLFYKPISEKNGFQNILRLC